MQASFKMIPAVILAQVGSQGTRQFMHELEQVRVYKNTALAGLFNWFIFMGPMGPSFPLRTRLILGYYVFMVISIITVISSGFQAYSFHGPMYGLLFYLSQVAIFEEPPRPF